MCIFAVPFGRGGEFIELLEDKSTSKYFDIVAYNRESKRRFQRGNPKAREIQIYTMKSLILAQDERQRQA